MLDDRLLFDPAEPLEPWLARVPAKWVVYLMSDVDDRPVQLLCVKNLRNSLKRRLGGEDVVGPSKRVVYQRTDSVRSAGPASTARSRPTCFTTISPDRPFPSRTRRCWGFGRRGSCTSTRARRFRGTSRRPICRSGPARWSGRSKTSTPRPGSFS